MAAYLPIITNIADALKLTVQVSDTTMTLWKTIAWNQKILICITLSKNLPFQKNKFTRDDKAFNYTGFNNINDSL